jgi:hypothetical protein
MEDSPRFRFVSFTFFVGFGVGSFIGVALALLAVTLVQRSDVSGTRDSQAFVIPTLPPPPPGVTATPDARPRTKTVQDVRVGPGFAFAIVGTLSRGEAVEVVGRDAAAGWVAIRFPAGSPGRGWVPVTELEGVSGLDQLAVALATPLPRSVTVPTNIFGGFGNDGPAVSNPVQTPGDDRVVGTPTPRVNAGPVDLVVNRVSVLADGRVRVVVGNIGPGDLVDQMVNVVVRDLTSQSELIISPQRGLAVGETVSLTTSHFIVRGERDVTAIADPSGNVSDRDRSNNVLHVVLSPVPVLTPTPNPFGQRGSDD